jgi:tetratricopeptide (TPR) repeat protein
VARHIILQNFDRPDCPSVAQAKRLDDGTIIAACTNGEIFRIFALRNTQLALRCSAAEAFGVPCSGKELTCFFSDLLGIPCPARKEPRTPGPTAAPVPASPSAHERGLAALDQDDFDAAIAEFTAAITVNPKDTFSYVRRAEAYEKRGDTALAIADYREVLKLVDDETGAQFAAKIRKLEKTRK